LGASPARGGRASDALSRLMARGRAPVGHVLGEVGGETARGWPAAGEQAEFRAVGGGLAAEYRERVLRWVLSNPMP
jgi:hypothetical protein